jgi:hypothetical protein
MAKVAKTLVFESRLALAGSWRKRDCWSVKDRFAGQRRTEFRLGVIKEKT